VILRYYGIPLVPISAGSRVAEVVEVGQDLPASQPTASGTISLPPLRWPDLTLLAVRPARPLTITRPILAAAGQPVLLEPSAGGLRWFNETQSLIIEWITAAKHATSDPKARSILRDAPATLHAARLGNPPAELPSASLVLSRLRQVSLRAAKLGANPNAPTTSAFHTAVVRLYAKR